MTTIFDISAEYKPSQGAAVALLHDNFNCFVFLPSQPMASIRVYGSNGRLHHLHFYNLPAINRVAEAQ